MRVVLTLGLRSTPRERDARMWRDGRRDLVMASHEEGTGVKVVARNGREEKRWRCCCRCAELHPRTRAQQHILASASAKSQRSTEPRCCTQLPRTYVLPLEPFYELAGTDLTWSPLFLALTSPLCSLHLCRYVALPAPPRA